MQPHPGSPLEASVLVLNKLFMAVHVISVRRAFCLLCKELAEVVSLEDGQFTTYNFETWREVSEFRAQQLPRGRRRLGADLQHGDPGAARHPPARLRKAAQADGEVQPPQHLRPRQQPVPVLRPEVPDQRAEPRPRHSAHAGGHEHVGEHRAALAWSATSARAAARPSRPT